MPKRWYHQDEFKDAFLFNLIGDDVKTGGGIPRGAVTDGMHGLVAAEAGVVGNSARVVPFKPNRRCHWQGFELRCMASPFLPAVSEASKSVVRSLRFAVASLDNPEVEAKARELNVPCVKTPEGEMVINIELATHDKQQNHGRRAKLI